MQALSSSPKGADDRRDARRQCVFCCEDIRPGASTCPHCGSNLAPVQAFADKYVDLEARVIALEQEVEALRAERVGQPDVVAVVDQAPVEPVAPVEMEFKWPHMADNIILGVASLLATHWLATTLP